MGVSNFNAKQVEVAFRELEKRGVPLVSNQVELSLCNQKALEDGTIDKVRGAATTRNHSTAPPRTSPRFKAPLPHR